ncbi:MAG: glycosyltransferase family 2 protein [Rickettsiales bacterium]|nr:glycosyltransferase family 2 protein [Rickettsiales bacterium]
MMLRKVELEASQRWSLVVSIVTYHSPQDEVLAAVASILGSTVRAHIILIDNHSDAAYSKSLQAALPASVFYHRAPRNGGFGYGHNLALLMAPPSDYLLILNPDAILHQGALESLLAFLEARPEVGLVAPKVLYEDGQLQPLNKRHPNVLDLVLRRLPDSALMRSSIVQRRLSHYQMLDMGYDTPYAVPFISGCCMMFRRDILQRLGGFDERFFLYFEDADLTRRVHCISQAWYCPEAVITHRWHRASKGNAAMFRILLQSAYYYFSKWGWAWW